MNKERLLKLADFLETVPDENFDLGSWRQKAHAGTWRQKAHADDYSAVTDTALASHACGTTGCAVGWACAMPEFQAEGLSFEITNPSFGGAVGVPHFVYSDTGETFTAWRAVRQFFDLKFGEDHHLFSDHRYAGGRGVKDVVARIREFVGSDE